MHRWLLLIVGIIFSIGVEAYEVDSVVSAVPDTLVHPAKNKQGWSFGVLPSVAYDTDLGFQGGLLTNVYDYGDGKQYPEYKHSIFAEGSYSTKHFGTARLNYDSRYMLPSHRITLDATYLPEAMCDFYGFNGYQSLYHSDWHYWNKNPQKMDTVHYQSRAYYKYKRDFVRVSADIEKELPQHFRVNAGIGVLGYMTAKCDYQMLNNSVRKDTINYLDPNVEGLFEKYVRWGLITPSESKGGWHPYARLGFTYDSRDQRACPTQGIYADCFFTYTAAVNSRVYGNQASEGYNHLQFNLTFRHYLTLWQRHLVFAYRIGTQNLVVGKCPYYLNTNLNTLFIQRVIYEGLGGGNSLRGVVRNRVLANGFAYANLELRFRIVNFDLLNQHFYVGLTPFFDMGIVTQPYTLDEADVSRRIAYCNERDGTGDVVSSFFSFRPCDVYRPHMSAGLGLKVAMNENFIVSVDWAAAFDKQDAHSLDNFYIKMGYLF